MKRDILVALAIGFILGSFVALIVVNLPTLIREGTKAPAISSPSPTGETAKITPEVRLLEIEQPADGTLTVEKTITLSGKTKSGNIIVLETDLESKIIEATIGGSFSSQITLTEGASNIHITSYDETGEGITKIITVFYTSEKL